jgi:two-component system, OmpR family, phosphate regulon sensor histidine kinase PhoR
VGQQERELQEASNFHAVLLAMAGHDLRQPLQVVKSTYEWLARKVDTDAEQEYLRRGRSAIFSLSNQLDLLIEALRLHQQSACIRLTPVALTPILSRIRDDSEDLACRKGIALRTGPIRAFVMSDAVLLDGVLRNLVRNALKYTPPGGRVLVGCRRRGEQIRIEVHDTGIGIPPEKFKEVFEAFRRLDSTRPDGLGLGLFVVRRTIDLLGHGIEVRSKVGVGSCFSVMAEVPRDILYGGGQNAANPR